jgi:demethylmenaquinone methyltransferase/2-methoxy-6-polyprenyl-1,4-benzoquinol methylase
MTEQRQLIDEQIAYYRARAPEYDDWWLRRGRYDRGDAHRQAWTAEIARLEALLDEVRPVGHVLELACGTGIWTERLARSASSVTAVDVSPEVLTINAARVNSDRVHYVREDLFEWEPQQRFDLVFFGFWLSHVPSAQFDRFWSKVQASLNPAGKVFFIDSLRAEDSTATNHVLPDASDPVTQRKLDDGRQFRIIKIFYAPAGLQNRLELAGWTGYVRKTGAYFIYGCVQRR